MALQANAVMTFADYTVLDSGITLHFTCSNPGPNQPSDYYITLTDAELATVTSLASFNSLLTTKFQRKYRSSTTSQLDTLIGRTLTV